MYKNYSKKNAERFGWTKKYEVILRHTEYDLAGILDTGFCEILGSFDDDVEALKCLENHRKEHSGTTYDEWGRVEESVTVETHFYNKKGAWKAFEFGIV